MGGYFPCLSAEAVGQGSGTLAHNMENLSKEANINAPSQSELITIILAASLRTNPREPIWFYPHSITVSVIVMANKFKMFQLPQSKLTELLVCTYRTG